MELAIKVALASLALSQLLLLPIGCVASNEPFVRILTTHETGFKLFQNKIFNKIISLTVTVLHKNLAIMKTITSCLQIPQGPFRIGFYAEEYRMKGFSFLGVAVATIACQIVSYFAAGIYLVILLKWNFLDAIFHPTSIIAISVFSYLIIFFGGYLSMQFSGKSLANSFWVGFIFFALNFGFLFLMKLNIETYEWLILFLLCVAAIPASLAGGKIAMKV